MLKKKSNKPKNKPWLSYYAIEIQTSKDRRECFVDVNFQIHYLPVDFQTC
jgi:hypothetical protein